MEDTEFTIDPQIERSRNLAQERVKTIAAEIHYNTEDREQFAAAFEKVLRRES